MRYQPNTTAKRVLDFLISKLSVTRESLNTKPEILPVGNHYTDFIIDLANEIGIPETDCELALNELEGKENIYFVMLDEADTYIEHLEIPTYP